MSMRDSRGYRSVLLLLSALCLVAAGYVAYRTYFVSSSAARQLTAADAAYAAGLNAYGGKNWGVAATRFDEAKLLSDKAVEELNEEAKAGKLPQAEYDSLLGRIMWVKARAVRDHAYAKAQADGKPLAELPDPQFAESYRAVSAIPDADARNEAISALRVAANLRRDDADVIKDALRIELVLQPIQWAVAQPLLQSAIQLNPKDARAHYYLARYDFEQPVGNAPVPDDRKSGDRMEQARDHLKAARENGSQYWRTTGLEAEILDWQVDTAAARRVKPDATAAAEKALDQLLFDPQTGAVGAVSRGDHLTSLGLADALGIGQVLSVGMDRALVDVGKPGGSADRVRAVTQAAYGLTNKAADDPALKAHLPEFLSRLVEIAVRGQPVLARADRAAWDDTASGIETLANTKGADAVKSRPGVRLALARIAYQDADLAARGEDPARAKDLVKRAVAQAEAGLKAAEEAKLPAPQVDEFHASLAEWKLAAEAPPEAVEPHLARLRESSAPAPKQRGRFLDAVVADRQGKLDKARKLLQTLLADRSVPDPAFRDEMTRRGNDLLAKVCAAAGDPAGTLAALRELEAAYRRQLERFSGGSVPGDAPAAELEGIIGRQVEATFNIAFQAASRFRKENPGKAVPGDLLAAQEKNAQGMMKKLRAPSAGDRTARLAEATFLALTGRRDAAEGRLAKLATDYPDSIEVLRARTQLLVLPKDPAAGTRLDENGRAEADVLIDKFLRDNPNDRAAKLFRAEWLVATYRPEKAVEYLKDPAVFPGGDAAANRILVNALSRAGQPGEAQRVLNQLPHDASVDAALIRAAATREAREKQIQDAIGRHENQGWFRLYEAAQRLADGKYEDAARGFASVIEVSEVRQSARVGLLLALQAAADADPVKAKDLTLRYAAEYPDEPAVYLAAADVFRRLEEVGGPADNWNQTKSLHAALNQWAAVAPKEGITDRAGAAVIKAQYRLLIGDVDGARKDALATLAQSPTHVPTLLLLTDLSLALPADTVEARRYYDDAVRVNSEDPRLPYYDARIKEAAGDWAGAAAVYERLATASPRNPAPYPRLVAALVADKRPADALRWARVWHERIPEDARATVELVRALIESGDRPGADKVAADFVARQVADARKAAAAAVPPATPEAADKAAEDARLAALLTTASGYIRAGDYAATETRASEVIKARPADARALMALGEAAIGRQEWDKALAAYREILKEQPRNYVAGNNLAWILAEKKNEPAAALTLVEDIRRSNGGGRPIAPERLPADVLDTLGVVYQKLNQPDRFQEMRSVFEAAVKRYPADPRMHLYLGVAQAATGARSQGLETLDHAARLADRKNGLKDEQNQEVKKAVEAAKKRF